MKTAEMRPLRAFAAAVLWWSCSIGLFVLGHWLAAPLERKAMSRAVDSALESAGDPRRVASPLPTRGPDGRASLAGCRFALKGKNETAVVFTVDGAGTTVSFVAVYARDRGIQSVLPLNAGSRRAADRLPAGLLETRIRRIAASEALADKRKAEK